MVRKFVEFALLMLLVVGSASAQSDLRLEQLPEYAAYQKAIQSRGPRTRGGGLTGLVWTKDGKSLNFKQGDETKSLSLTTFQVGPASTVEGTVRPERKSPPRKSAVGRAEQRTVEISPDGKCKAVFRDNNIVIESATEGDTMSPIQVTTTGTERLRFGTGCWVYGEELDQDEAMWWTPDGAKLFFYEVDEQGLNDYYLTVNNVDAYTQLHVTRYPKSGFDNPQVNLMCYDIATKETRRLTIEGEPRQYLFNIRFTPDAKELLVNRTNRRQDVLDVLAIDISSGNVRTVLTEKQSTWQTNSPAMRFLEDGQRFIWETEANGWKNFELRDLSGKLLSRLTSADGFPCEKIVDVDEAGGWFYYTAYSGENPYNEQLFRVRLDGSREQLLTRSPHHHTAFDIDPAGNFVVATRQQINVAPQRAVYKMDGTEVAVLPDDSAAEATPVNSEIFSCTAADGTTQIWVTLHKPSDFDPAKKYPLVIDVYGGPNSRGLSNTFSPGNPLCELGFLVAKIGNRGTAGRGKAFESATYMKLGGADLDDQVAGVRALCQRPYVDSTRVGIFGHSYGGYMSALAMLRYPEVFHVAVAGAPVTDWRNYDSIYTERYMRTPQENEAGYKAGSCMEYVKNLSGKLLIVHGLIDDNVHPANTWQLIKALEDSDQRFDLMIYPEFKHGIGSNYNKIRVEYLYQHLMTAPSRSSAGTE